MIFIFYKIYCSKIIRKATSALNSRWMRKFIISIGWSTTCLPCLSIENFCNNVVLMMSFSSWLIVDNDKAACKDDHILVRFCLSNSYSIVVDCCSCCRTIWSWIWLQSSLRFLHALMHPWFSFMEWKMVNKRNVVDFMSLTVTKERRVYLYPNIAMDITIVR